MNSNYTSDDLLLFLYGEMEAEKAAGLSVELKTNAHLRAEFDKLDEMIKKLGDEEYEPDPTSVNMVLDYSTSYHSAPEHHTD